VWYFILFGLLALWVGFDASRRNLGAAKAILWVIGTFLLGVIVMPIYIAKRPLKANEVREGGLAWNLLKNFALTWTVLMVAISISAIGAAAGGTNVNSDAEAAGAAIGMSIVVVILAVVWFFPMVGAIVLGFFLKNSAIVERGPTGSLAQEARVT
jgi:preprotein translocase subunit SecG